MDKKDKITVLMGIYQAVRDNQEFYKRQQWMVVYYAILAYGAIFATHNYLDRKHELLMYVFGGIACFVCILVIRAFQVSLSNERQFIENIKKEIPLIREISKEKKKPKAYYIPVLMYLLNLSGYAFLIFIICMAKK